ncbi:MAG: SDR family oxidoreductase [Proteobacteria bacterium]|nr:SDR family oxidoreductase [Pseudomonadota bacterium]
MRAGAGERLFCFGFGYSAEALARGLRARGWRVAGTSRSEEKLARMSAAGFESFVFDRARPLADPEGALAGTTHLLVSVPPDEAGDPVLARHAAEIAGLRSLAWAGHLSTTGVYGDTGGAVVDETSAPAPASARSRRRAEAEEAWLHLWRKRGVPVHVFRLAGIYGPGRSALDQVRAGRARRIDKPGQLFSRVHVDDIAGVLTASITRPRPGAIYNVCDDEPAPQAEVVAFACRLLGIEPPPVVPFDEAAAEMGPMARSFWAESRRVSNARIKRELGVTLLYPTYREGLAAILKAERG